MHSICEGGSEIRVTSYGSVLTSVVFVGPAQGAKSRKNLRLSNCFKACSGVVLLDPNTGRRKSSLALSPSDAFVRWPRSPNGRTRHGINLQKPRGRPSPEDSPDVSWAKWIVPGPFPLDHSFWVPTDCSPEIAQPYQ